jgi:menaquinone-9 beta-reductase
VKSKIENRKSKIVVVGGAVAGASAAIHLRQAGFEVALIERERFPREKLCGEFVSPECFAHFRALGVLDEMRRARGVEISETVFFAPDGASVAVPSQWFRGKGYALGISRATMDLRLLEKAKNAGVEVLEETQAANLIFENNEVRGVVARGKTGETREIVADLTIDATGRAAVLSKLVSRENAKTQTKIKNQKSKIKNSLVGFKAHLENARVERGRCEIYFFPRGYGGLNFVENNFANHCFLLDARVVREFGGDVERIVREVVFKNQRAAQTLCEARPVHEWLAVAVDDFGRKRLNPAPRLFSVGDAAAFIDPFTGSGMLMALESAELLSHLIANFGAQRAAEIAARYEISHRQKFDRRLRVCAVLRRAAFVPGLAATTIRALGFSRAARELLARATRGGGGGSSSNRDARRAEF